VIRVGVASRRGGRHDHGRRGGPESTETEAEAEEDDDTFALLRRLDLYERRGITANDALTLLLGSRPAGFAEYMRGRRAHRNSADPAHAAWLGLFAFCLWCTASYLTMEIYAVLRPEKVKATLNALLEWINTHTDQAIVFLSLGLGLYLMAKSIYDLTT
jgi:Sap-like sulfolipid-1-addressing protein